MILMVHFQLEIFCDSVFHRKGTTCILFPLTHHKNDETFPFEAIRKEIDKINCVIPLMKGLGERISSCIPGRYIETAIRTYHKHYSNTCTKTFYCECNEDIDFFLIWGAYINWPILAEWPSVCRARQWLDTLQLQSFAKVNLLRFCCTLGELQKSNTSFKADISRQPKLGHTIWRKEKIRKELC